MNGLGKNGAPSNRCCPSVFEIFVPSLHLLGLREFKNCPLPNFAFSYGLQRVELIVPLGPQGLAALFTLCGPVFALS